MELGVAETILRLRVVATFTLDGVFTDVNAMFEQIMGYARHEVVGQHERVLLDSKAAARPEYEQFWAALREGTTLQGEHRRVRKGGTPIWLRGTWAPIKVDGRIDRITMVVQEMTDEKVRLADFGCQISAIQRTQAVASFSPDGVVLDVNALFLKAMGYTRDEVVGQHHRLFIDSKAAERPEYERFWAALKEGTAQQGEFKRVGKGGTDVWLSATYTPIMVDGAVVKVVKFAQDVTKEKLRIADTDGQISAIVKTQAMAVFSVDGKLMDANEIFLRTMGYTLEELVGQPHRSFVKSSTTPEYLDFWQALRAGHARSDEFKRWGKGDREVYWRAVYTPIVLDGRVIKIIMFAQDVTKEKLRNADFEGQIGAISQTHVVASFTPDGTICEVNKLFEHTMGYARDEVVGQHHRLLMVRDFDDHGACRECERFWAALKEGKAQQGEFKRFRKGGEHVWLSATYTPILVDGQVVKVVKFALDVTAVKHCNADFQAQIGGIRQTQAVVTFSPDGKVTDVNELFLQVRQKEREEKEKEKEKSLPNSFGTAGPGFQSQRGDGAESSTLCGARRRIATRVSAVLGCTARGISASRRVQACHQNW
jgi:methyl-accepting chemotaxis protein